MRVPHALRSLAVVATLTASVGLLGGAAPAAAATGITSPGDGLVVAADAVVALRAFVDGPTTAPSELRLLAPGTTTGEVVAVRPPPEGGELAYDFDTACARRVCEGRDPAPNGRWAVQLTGGGQDERTFVLRIPPAAPSGVSAAPREAAVRVEWSRGAEPDLRGYRVEDAQGRVVRAGIGLDACSASGTCGVDVPPDAGAWRVLAFRSTCPDCTEQLASSASPAVRSGETAPTPPPAGPALPEEQSPAPPGGTPGATPQGSTAPGGGTTGSAGSAGDPDRAARREAFARAFSGSAGRSASGTPGSSAPTRAPSPAPEPDGEFEESLGYAPRDLSGGTLTSRTKSRGARAVQAALEGDRTRLFVAGAVLLAAAVGLRLWARRTVED